MFRRAIIWRALRSITSFTAQEAQTDILSLSKAHDTPFELRVESEDTDFLQPRIQRKAPVHQEPVGLEYHLDEVVEKLLEGFRTVSACLEKEVGGDAKEVASFLLDAEIAPERLFECVRRYPELLLMELDDLRSRIDRFRKIGMKKTAVFEMLASNPEVFGFDFDTELRPILEFFTKLLGDASSAVELISQSPAVLTYSLELDIRPKVAFLSDIGCRPFEIASLIEGYPSILCLSIEKSIQAKIDYLHSRLPEFDVKHAVMTFPAFLDMSLEAHVKEKVEFFLELLQVNPQRFAKYLPYFPEIFSCEIEENIKHKIEFLCYKMCIVKGRRKRMKLVKAKSLVFMACPSIFGFSRSRLNERIERIRYVIFSNEEILDHLLVQCPLMFGCTIETEDIERVQRLVMDALDGNRYHFLRIVKQHPDILLKDPDDIDALLTSLSRQPITGLVQTLSNKIRFEGATRRLKPDRALPFRTDRAKGS